MGSESTLFQHIHPFWSTDLPPFRMACVWVVPMNRWNSMKLTWTFKWRLMKCYDLTRTNNTLFSFKTRMPFLQRLYRMHRLKLSPSSPVFFWNNPPESKSIPQSPNGFQCLHLSEPRCAGEILLNFATSEVSDDLCVIDLYHTVSCVICLFILYFV